MRKKSTMSKPTIWDYHPTDDELSSLYGTPERARRFFDGKSADVLLAGAVDLLEIRDLDAEAEALHPLFEDQKIPALRQLVRNPPL